MKNEFLNNETNVFMKSLEDPDLLTNDEESYKYVKDLKIKPGPGGFEIIRTKPVEINGEKFYFHLPNTEESIKALKKDDLSWITETTKVWLAPAVVIDNKIVFPLVTRHNTIVFTDFPIEFYMQCLTHPSLPEDIDILVAYSMCKKFQNAGLNQNIFSYPISSKEIMRVIDSIR